jgi:hypothetical protein
MIFDVSRDWLILAPYSVPAARRGAEELSRYIDLLRRRAGNGKKPPLIEDAAAAAPADSVPLILLNPGDGGPYRNGFSWRLGEGRLEIYGDSSRGLWNGIFDFLDALGLRWPEPDRRELPPPPPGGLYPLRDHRAYKTSDPPAEIPRLIIDGKENNKNRDALIHWAARNKIDVLILPLRDWRRNRPRRRGGTPDAAEQYALIREAGGWELSLLIPRRFFLFRRDLFRMEMGKRSRHFNFCPTNPASISLIKKEAAKFFGILFSLCPETEVIHLWPDRGHEKTWCSCPACRAFSAGDLYRIALNAAADVLAELAPQARLSLPESFTGEDETGGSVSPRPNILPLNRLPCRKTDSQGSAD